MTFVKTSDVDWVQADGNYVRVHTGSVSHLIRETLGDSAQPTVCPRSRSASCSRLAVSSPPSMYRR